MKYIFSFLFEFNLFNHIFIFIYIKFSSSGSVSTLMKRNLRQCRSLSPNTVAALAAGGVRTCGDFYACGQLRLLQLLPGADAQQVASVGLAVARVVAPRPATARALHDRLRNSDTSVCTGLPRLDAALGRGIPSDTVTELVGRAGVGKTQTCLTLAVQACLPKHLDLAATTTGTVVYLDTERKFSAERVLQIAMARVRAMDVAGNLSRVDVQAVAKTVVERIHVFTLCSCDALLAQVTSLQPFIIERDVKLVVVDSVAAVARQDFSRGLLVKRQQWLNRIASELKCLAELFHLPVVVTNQVTTKMGGAGTGPRLRHQRWDGGSGAAEEGEEEQEGGEGVDVARVGMVDDGQTTDQRFRAHVSKAAALQPALGNTWAHGVNIRLFVDVDAVAGTNHGTQRCIRITKSPTAPYLCVPFVLTEAGVAPADQ